MDYGRWVSYQWHFFFAVYPNDTNLRYEFAQNEFVNAVESIPLETLSTEQGLKDYIVVGTTISRGEDLAVKGAVRHLHSLPKHEFIFYLDICVRGRRGRPQAWR